MMQIRAASIADAQTLFDWRNDIDTRKAAKTMDLVVFEDHIAWLERRLARAKPDLYIAEIDGVPVGTYRLDDGFVSYTVAPQRRGQGVGREMLTEVGRRHGHLKAEIKKDNAASIRASKRAGYEITLL